MDQKPVRNLILKTLPKAALDDVLNVAEFVHYDLKEKLIEPNKAISYVEFPDIGVLSLLQPLEDGSMVEINTIGKEGMVGWSLLLGLPVVPQLVFCQVPGEGRRIEKDKFSKLIETSPELKAVCLRYMGTLFDQVSRNTACNNVHTTEQRCARWLLMTQDRCESDEFPLTQEFLAYMLGISRTVVNSAATALQKANLISYVRGKIKVLDRTGLEAKSCECYFAMLKNPHLNLSK